MQKLKLFLLISLVGFQYSFAQCPVAAFTLSDDTICGGDQVSFTNNSTGGSGYQWDFCTGDLLLTPTGVSYAAQGNLSSPYQNRAVIDGTDHYLFIASNGNSELKRYDFGNSFNNSPLPYSYGNVGGLINNMKGLDVLNEAGTWYVLILNGAGNIIRINLGASINNNTVVSSYDFGVVIPAADAPISLKIMTDGTSYHAFVANYFGNSITRVDFGSSLSNSTATATPFIDNNNLQTAFGIDMIHDCENSKYVAYVSGLGTGFITVVDYGPSLTGTPTVQGHFTVAGTRGVTALHEGDSWYLLATNSSNNYLHVFKLGADPANINAIQVFADTVAGSGINDPLFMSSIQDSSISYCFTSNTNANTNSKIVFPQNCSASISYSGDQNPAPVLFSNGGINYITIAVNNNNQVSYYTDSVYVSSAPATGFSFSAGCLGQPVYFTDTSTIGQGSITAWQWDFGDLSPPDFTQNPTHTYINDSTFLVTLTATSDAGCSATFSDSISIRELPVADFSFVNNQCSETPVQFTDQSTVTSIVDSIVAWEWNFGDGTPLDLLQNPIHSFDTSGTFQVQLVVFGSSGCSDTNIQSITIKPRPVISFTVSQTCVGETTLFSNGTTISGGSTLSYVWTFGDGSATSTATDPTHPYPLIAATYQVQLIANSTNGCADTLLQNVHISTRANPGFTITPATACINNTVQFIDTSTIAAGDTIILSSWDFGDSTSGTGDTVSHVYTSSGTFNVILTVTSQTSCDTSITIQVTVLESPVANFTFTNVCMNAPMYFYDSSSTPIGSVIDSIIWDFGDSTSLEYGDTVVHGYSAAGIYNVTQTVINNFGCSGTITQQVTVYAIPLASFTVSTPVCTGNPVNFTNTSTVQNDSITGNLWDFGDIGTGDTSTLSNPSYIYNNVQTSIGISLIVTSSHGCQATVTNFISVIQSPTFNFTDSLFCLGDYTHFTYVPLLNPGSSWLWNFGDNGTAIIPNPVHHYDSSGIYNVTLTVLASNGCSNTVSHSVTINPKPEAGIISESFACDGTTLTFDDSSTISSGVINQWLWNFGDGTAIDTMQNTAHNYGSDTTFNVIHIVISVAGCADTVSKMVEIVPMPVASFTPDPTFGPPPLFVHFDNNSTGAISYQWTFGDGGNDIVSSPTHSYADTGYYTVTLIATNSYNCSDTAYGHISVLIPYLDLAVKEVQAIQLNDLLSLKAELINLGNIPVDRFQISAQVENGSPINEQWSSVIPIAPGQKRTYPFVARYEIDPLNAPSFYCIEISEINDMTDAVESNNKKCSALSDLFELFDIFPNPTNDQVNIGMNVPLDGTIDISIYNAAGQLMKLNVEIPVTKGYNGFNYSIRHFAKGVYACTVKYRDDVQVKKIAKK